MKTVKEKNEISSAISRRDECVGSINSLSIFFTSIEVVHDLATSLKIFLRQAITVAQWIFE